MSEKQPQFKPLEEERPEISLDRWAEAQMLDFVIKNTRAKRLRTRDFIKVKHYGEDTVAEDEAVVEALERKFKAKLEGLPPSDRARHELSQKRGEALEIIIAEQGELSDWFGPDAMTIRTTKLDDYRNKVDLVVEFEPEKGETPPIEKDVERLALGIDASDNPLSIADKMQINREKLLGQRPPAHVRYFRSQVTDYVGPLDKVVPIVVGLEGKNMAALAHLQHQSLRGINPKEINKQLANHPAQRVLLEEIVAQLRWYMRLLEQEETAHATYEKKDIEGLLRMMEELLAEKKSISLGELGEDMVMQKIQKMVK